MPVAVVDCFHSPGADLTKCKQSIVELTTTKDKLSSEISKERKTNSSLSSQISSLNSELEEAKTEYGNERKSWEQQSQTYQQTISEKESEFNQRIENLSSLLQDEKSSNFRLTEQLSQIQNTLQTCEQDLNTCKETIAELTTTKDKLSSEISSIFWTRIILACFFSYSNFF